MANSMLDREDLKSFYSAVLQLKSVDECKAFFEDICTIGELQALSQRLQVAKLLREKMTYQSISKETGASTATISRVNRCVVYGTGGYDLVLERIK